MAKLLVSHLGSPTSPAGAADTGCAATRRGHREGPAAAARGNGGASGGYQGGGSVSLLPL